jgi:hypothetical protein
MKNTTIILLAITAIVFITANAQSQTKESEFKPGGTVWGYVFGDFAYKFGGDNTKTWGQGEYAKMKKEESKFAFRRIYLGYDYKMAPNFSGRILLESGDGVLTNDGRRTVFIKSAELEWKNIIPNASLFIGQTSTPTWPGNAEKFWTLRSVEKTVTDFRKMGISNDLGLRLTGKFSKDSELSYTIMLGNGTAEKVELNKFKKVYGSIFTHLLDKKLFIEVQADHEPSLTSKGDKVSTVSYHALIAYKTPKLTIGFEPAMQVYEKAKNNLSEDLKPFGMSVYAIGNLIDKKLAGFVRYDTYNFDLAYENADIATNPYDERFFLAGLDYTPHPNFHIMPNLWINTYNDKRQNGVERDADVVGRITFYYNFR